MKTKKNKTNKVAKTKNTAKISRGKKVDETFKNWPIKKKLLFSHISIIVSAVILVVLLLIGMMAIKSNIVKLYEGPTSAAFYVGDIRWGVVEKQRAMNLLIALGEDKLETSIVTLEEDIAAVDEVMTEAIAQLQETLITEDSLKKLNGLIATLDESVTQQERMLTLLKSGQFATANAYNDEKYSAFMEIVTGMADDLDQSISESAEACKNNAVITAYIMMAIGFVLLICVIIFALVLVKKVTKALVPPIKVFLKSASRKNEFYFLAFLG